MKKLKLLYITLAIASLSSQVAIASPTTDKEIDTATENNETTESQEPYGGDTSILDENIEGEDDIGYKSSQEQIEKVNELIEQKQAEESENNGSYTPQISFGADLSEEAKEIVLNLLQIPSNGLSEYETTIVTHEEETNRLSNYIPESKLGNGAISCVAMRPLPTGSGISIGTVNIDYVTELMYYNVLVTAGVKDVEVKVAAPTNSSGSCALVGMLNAYQNMTGEKISDKVIDVAMNEMYVIDTLGNKYGADTTSKLLDRLKGKIIENGSTDVKAIKGIVRGIAEIQKITLSDEECQMIAECMAKITDLSNERKLMQMESNVKYIGTKDFKKEIDEFGKEAGKSLVDFILCK